MAFFKRLVFLQAVTCNAAYFHTEPIFLPEIFNTSLVAQDQSLIAPGYIFMEPLNLPHAWGPQIYAQDGTLVFAGGNRRVQDFKQCDYLGEEGTHLCFHQSRFNPDTDPRIQKRSIEDEPQEPPRPVGKKLIFDNTYALVGTEYSDGIGEGKEKNWPNGHEYNMLKGGESFLQAVYKPKVWDLREYTGKEEGWILDGCFQERSVRTGEALFEWCYSDHLEIWETSLYFMSRTQKVNETSSKAGRGVITNPWDFIHLNAVDKTPEGDYLVSGRHLDQIIKIAGPENRHGLKPGSLIWRVGGKSNEFEMEGGLLFTKQHDVRHVSTTATETTISFFNNAWEGTNEPSANRSAGMIISVNNATMKAQLLHEYPHPDGILGRAMGSMQILPNRNVLVGWGAAPQITEFTEDGTVVWHTWYNLPDWEKLLEDEDAQHEWTYRAFKFPWVGKPHWDPKLVAYSRYCSANHSPLMAHVSWNGATEVAKWRFSVSMKKTGPWIPAGTVLKDGFETSTKLSVEWPEEALPFVPWVAAEALGHDDEVLRRTVSKTFVPSIDIVKYCDTNGCSIDKKFHYGEKYNCSWKCRPINWWAFAVAVLILILFEAMSIWADRLCRMLVDLELDGNLVSFWESLRSGEALREAQYRILGLEAGIAKSSKPIQ